MAGKHRAPAPHRIPFLRSMISVAAVTGAMLIAPAAASADPIVTVPMSYSTPLDTKLPHINHRVIHHSPVHFKRAPVRHLRFPIFHGPIRRIHHPLCVARKVWFDRSHHRHVIPARCY